VPSVARSVRHFVALGPASRARGLAPGIVKTFVETVPEVVYAVFGTRALLGSVIFWRNLLTRTFFIRLIEGSCKYLFNWTMVEMSEERKQLT
jgi:lysosomal acid lipase/cholesteryl ester hydrolase